MVLNAHSAYQYNLLIKYYRSLDNELILERMLREAIVQNLIFTTTLKHIFLRRMVIEGKLICVYCQMKLNIYHSVKQRNAPKDMATIEHNTPVSEGGMKYNEVNFLCACMECNHKRDNLPNYKVTETKYIF